MNYDLWIMSDEWGVYPIAPGGSTLLITPDASLGIHKTPTLLSASRRDALSESSPPLPTSQRPGGTRSQSACPLGHGLRPTWSKPQTQVWGPTGPLLPPLSVPEGRALWRQHKQHKQQSQCNTHWARAPHVAGRKLSALSMLSLEKKIHTTYIKSIFSTLV